MLNRLFPQGLSIRQDPSQAAHWNSAAAQGDDAGAQARLGYQYAAGLGVEPDLAAAEQWMSAAAAQNHAAGQLGLGMLYCGSFGGSMENARAIEWFEKAAAQDNATAKLCLAQLLLYGEDVTHDEERARESFARCRGRRAAGRDVPFGRDLSPGLRCSAQRIASGKLAAACRRARSRESLVVAGAAIRLGP